MVIFFIILISIIATGAILIACSTLKIDIKTFILINKKVEKFEIVLSLNLFGKIKWLKIKLDNKKINKIRNSTKLKTFNKILDTKILKKYKNSGKILLKNWRSLIGDFNEFEIEKLELEGIIGTENAATTAILTGIISAILGIILAKKTKNPQYKIKPIYINKNHIYLSINCIISIKLVHIINMNKKLGKGVYQDHARTSNRRAYANSNG